MKGGKARRQDFVGFILRFVHEEYEARRTRRSECAIDVSDEGEEVEKRGSVRY